MRTIGRISTPIIQGWKAGRTFSAGKRSSGRNHTAVFPNPSSHPHLRRTVFEISRLFHGQGGSVTYGADALSPLATLLGSDYINLDFPQKIERVKSYLVANLERFGDKVVNGQTLKLEERIVKKQTSKRNLPREVVDYPLRWLSDYIEILGIETIEKLIVASSALKGKKIININSSSDPGGGVAELLYSQISFLRQLGIDARWIVIGAEEDTAKEDKRFFPFTKQLHNSLQGVEELRITPEQAKYNDINYKNASKLKIKGTDIFILHDPQVIPQITHFKNMNLRAKFIWRCHIDLTKSHQKAWDVISSYVNMFDLIILSSPLYIKDDMEKTIVLITPTIDPLAEKNNPQLLSNHPGKIEEFLRKNEIDPEKPIILQVGRADPAKGFDDLIGAFLEVHDPDAQLVLAFPDPGSISDDAQASEYINKIEGTVKRVENKNKRKRIKILLLPTEDRTENHRLVGLLQRKASVITILSTREGFGLVATEALNNNGSVISTNRGGLPLQVVHRETGRVVSPAHFEPGESHAEVAQKVGEYYKRIAREIELLLENPGKHQEEARRYAAKNFYVDTSLLNWINICSSSIAGIGMPLSGFYSPNPILLRALGQSINS